MEDIFDMAQGNETTKARMPQQFVREGRGVAGYTGNVEVYNPRDAKPKNVKRVSGETKARTPKEDK